MSQRFSNRGGRGVLPILLMLTAGALRLYAGGGADSPDFDPKIELENAAALVEQGRLDDAIALLTEIARRDPEQMERVQDQILEIRGIKTEINTLFSELVSAINEGDEEQAADIIDQIKELDTDPNRNTRNDLILAAKVVGKEYNDGIRDLLFDLANARLAAGDYRGAVEIYRAGFIAPEDVHPEGRRYSESYDDYVDLARNREPIVLYEDDSERQEKIWEAYGSIAPEGNRLIDELESALDAWDVAAATFSGLLEPAAAAVNSTDPENWPTALAGFENSLAAVQSDIRASSEISRELENTRVELYAALDGIPEDFRYERIGEFLSGRPDQDDDEGIFVAQREQRNAAYLRVAEEMDTRIAALVRTGRSAYRSGDWNRADADFRTALAAAQAAEGFADRAADTLGEPTADTPASTAYRLHAASAASIWLELTDLDRSLPILDTLDFRTVTIADIDALADPIQAAVSRAETLREDWNASMVDLARLAGAAAPGPVGIDTSLRSDLGDAIDRFRDRRLQLYVNAIIPLYENLQAETAGIADLDIEGIRRLINGPELPEGSTALPERRPIAALETRILPAQALVAAAEEDIGAFLDVVNEMLDREPPLGDPEEIRGYAAGAESLLLDVAANRDALDDLQDEAEVFATAARRAATSANNVLNQARQDLQTAQANVARGEELDDIDEFYRAVDLYAAVEQSLDDLDELFLEILVNDVDLAESSGLDAAREALRNQIQDDRSQLAVRVKRNAVDEARSAYDDGRYSYGVGVLIQSQEFWNRAYNEDDAELAAWLVRLQNAQAALQYSEIAPNDPLFAEMNQYLNLANRFFADGLRRVDSDPRAALESFRAAGDLAEQVLNTFPGNEAALLLEQKILRQTDEDVWSRQAQDLVGEARGAVRRGDVEALRGSEREKGLYPQVLVLQEIDPNFPGLEDLIFDIRVAVGEIPPPKNPADVAESRRLAAEAEQIFDNLGAAGSQRAIQLLDQALALDLDNREASVLKDRILLAAEPERLPALPPELLQLISLFDQAFAERNYVLSRIILNRMLADYPASRTDPRIQERLRKQEAVE